MVQPQRLDKTFEATLVQSPAKGGWTDVVADWTGDTVTTHLERKR